MPTPDNKSVVQEFYDQWNAGVIDFDRLVREDITNHQPDVDPDVGLDNFRRAVNAVMAAVPDSEWTTLNLIADGDLVVCHNRWSGTYGSRHVDQGVLGVFSNDVRRVVTDFSLIDKGVPARRRRPFGGRFIELVRR